MAHDIELCRQWQNQHLERHALELASVGIARDGDNRVAEIARDALEHRLEGMNELRSQIEQERGQFVSRDFYDEQHNSLRESTDVRLKALETMRANLEGRMWAIGAFISIIVVILNLVLHYIH